jgi:NAD(P)-dependent dehydrogenase (short-subunit alcohol dehydrogenase family)
MTVIGKPLALITGATSGIGLELAKLAAADGYALLLAADRPFERALAELSGAAVETTRVDLSTPEGVAALVAQVGEREVDVLCANAGQGLSKGFLDQDFTDVRKLIGTNVVGTLDLVQQIGRSMRARQRPHPAHGLARRPPPWGLSGGLQCLEGLHRQLQLRPAQRAEGHGRHRHLPHAERHRDRLLGTRRRSREQGRVWQEGSARGSREGRLGGDEGGGRAVSPGYFDTLQRAIMRVLPRDALAEVNAKEMQPRRQDADPWSGLIP